jgi:hypothetical protein
MPLACYSRRLAVAGMVVCVHSIARSIVSPMTPRGEFARLDRQPVECQVSTDQERGAHSNSRRRWTVDRCTEGWVSVAQRAPSPWVFLFGNSDISMFIDSSRVSGTAQWWVVWVRAVEAVALPAPDFPGKKYTRGEVRLQINCSTRVAREITTVMFDSAGVQLGYYTDPSPHLHNFESSLGRPTYSAVCAWLLAHRASGSVK